MNQNYYEPNPCYDLNSFGFYQIQPSQLLVIHQSPQETSKEVLQARDDLLKSIETFLKKFNRISFRETPKVLSLAWEKFFEIQHAQPDDTQELLHKPLNDVQTISEELADYVNTPSWNRPIVYCNDDDDEEYTIASSVEDLVPIPSESEGIFDNMCDVPCCDKNHFDAESDLMKSLLNQDTLIIYSPKIDSLLDEFAGELAPINPIPLGIHPEKDIRLVEQLLYDDTLSDDDSYEDIDYVDASPLDSELVSLKEVKDFHTKNGEIEDDILREKLSKINLLIAKIEALNANPTQSSDFVTKSPSTFLNFFLEETNTFDNSLPESETFCFDLEENSSGSTTTHSDISLSKYDSFIFDLSNDPFPPADGSDFYHGEFADELAHIISPSEIAQIFEASRACGFVLRSLELQILSFILGIQYLNLID
ncbi:hypothetical protein Tco_0091522 [Tanacetum coccineum]